MTKKMIRMTLLAFGCSVSAAWSLAQSGNSQIGLSINAPNGYPTLRVQDLRLSSSAGPVRWERQWDGREWQFNPHWESLSQSWTNLTGAQTGTPSAGAALGTPTDAAAGCWVMVDEDWQPQKGTVLIDERPPFPPMLSERTAPFNKLMGEDGDAYPPPRLVSVDYASLCKGIPLQNSPVRDLEAVRLKNELYMGENGRYAYSNRAMLEKRPVRGLLPAAPAALDTQLATGSVTLAPVDVSKGYRWSDKNGTWIDYNTQGQAIAYGDRNNNTVWLARDSGGTLRGVVDGAGRVLYSLHYTGKLITEVRDYPVAGLAQDLPARSVKYQYDAGNRLIAVIDVRGNKTSYDYDAGNHLVSITDQENRVTRLEYAGASVKKMTAPDQGVTDFLFEYDDVNKQFTSRITGPETAPGRRVDVLTHNRSGQLLRRVVNGVLDEERQYDTGARAELWTNARGFTSRTTFNEFGQVVRQEREDGSVVSSTFSALNLALLEETDALGTKTRYERDANGNLTRLIEAAGTEQQRITDYVLDEAGRVLRQTVRGRTERNGVVTADALTVNAYDARGHLRSKTDPEGGQTQTVFDRAGNLVLKIDARNHSAAFVVNPAGLTTRLTDPLKRIWTYEYDKVGNRTALIDPGQRRTSYVFDGANRPTETADAKGRALLQYDLQGMPTLVSDADGTSGRFEYDNWQRVVRQIDGAGNVTRFSYDIADGSVGGRLGSLGTPTTIVHPTFVEQNRFDQMERPTSTVLSAPGEAERGIQTQYDARGLARTSTDPMGKSSVTESDLFGRPVLLVDRLQNKTAISYDVRGNPIEYKDANGKLRRLAYDRNNRLVSETLALGQASSRQYDANGNVSVLTDPNGNKAQYTYDAGNRVIELRNISPSGVVQRIVTTSYDDSGYVRGWVSDEDGQRTSAVMAYDEAGRKVSESVTYPGGYSMKYGYAYSAAGNKTGVTLPDDSVIGYSYSKHGQLETVSVPGEGMISVTAFDWTSAAQVTLPGGTVQTRQYDGFGNLKGLEVRTPGQQHALAMSASFGLRQEISKSVRVDSHLGSSRTRTFGYDDELRLRTVGTEVAGGAVVNETFALDGLANRTAHSVLPGPWTYDDNQRLTQRGSAPASMTAYQYDEAGNVIRTEEAGKVTRFFYNGAGRLVAVKDGAGHLIARYGYDPLGRRIWKEQFRNRAGTPLANAQRTLFLYADEGLLAEASQDIALNDDQTVLPLTAPSLSTLYGPRPDSTFTTGTLFIRTRNSNAGMTTAYYHHDERQAPVQATDRNGHIVWAADYDAFGRATIITPSASAQIPTIASRLRLPGQMEDEETGLHYNFHRDYDPQTGRYLQSDPIGLDGGINTYAYVGGNPLTFIDPEGLVKIPFFVKNSAVIKEVRESARHYGVDVSGCSDQDIIDFIESIPQSDADDLKASYDRRPSGKAANWTKAELARHHEEKAIEIRIICQLIKKWPKRKPGCNCVK